MAPEIGLWLIDGTRPHEGTGNAPCAALATGGATSTPAPTTAISPPGG